MVFFIEKFALKRRHFLHCRFSFLRLFCLKKKNFARLSSNNNNSNNRNNNNNNNNNNNINNNNNCNNNNNNNIHKPDFRRRFDFSYFSASFASSCCRQFFLPHFFFYPYVFAVSFLKSNHIYYSSECLLGGLSFSSTFVSSAYFSPAENALKYFSAPLKNIFINKKFTTLDKRKTCKKTYFSSLCFEDKKAEENILKICKREQQKIYLKTPPQISSFFLHKANISIQKQQKRKMRTCVGEKSSYSQADNHNEKHKETSEASITSSSSSFSACGLSAEEKLRLLREEMKKSAVDTYIIYTCDMHNSEITCEYDCRRAFISNFTGSAGVVVVTLKEALLWTDGRYASQAPLQLSATAGWILMKSWLKETPDVSTWIETQNHLHSVGIDAYRTPVAEYAKLTKLKKKNKKVKLLEENLVDKIWTEVYNRPPFPMNDIYIHPLHRCGMHTQKKIAMCREAMQKQDTQAILFSSLDDVAWMLNLRGSDIPFSPLFFAFFILTNQSAILYTQEKKINENVRKYLEENKILLKEYDSIAEDIGPLAASEKITKWWLDRFVSCGLYDLVFRQTRNVHLQNEQNEKEKKEKKSENGKEEEEKKEEEKKEEEMLLDSFLETKTNPFVLLRATPAHMAKSKKNDVEIEGMREAHIKDGLALTQFLHWIHKRLESGEIEKETECTFADKLDFFRAQQEDFVSLSFPSISAFGQNGAIIHYKADKKECLGIKANGMYLFDSGSHYSHGTTDVTRTIFLPLNELHSPTPFQKKAFTLVLKGNMGIATAVFPENTSGVLLDVLARRSLWESGLDYRHGTGHGVGYCLNVHEGPHGITPNANCAAAHVPLESGMIVSNEPGFYLQDNFGIRIENLLLVREANFSSTFENVKFYKFEDLTLVPLQSCLIDKTLLTEQEVQWVNDYNRRVYEILSKRFEEEQKKKDVDYTEVIDFLKNYTKPI